MNYSFLNGIQVMKLIRWVDLLPQIFN